MNNTCFLKTGGAADTIKTIKSIKDKMKIPVNESNKIYY